MHINKKKFPLCSAISTSFPNHYRFASWKVFSFSTHLVLLFASNVITCSNESEQNICTSQLSKVVAEFTIVSHQQSERYEHETIISLAELESNITVKTGQ